MKLLFDQNLSFKLVGRSPQINKSARPEWH